jgi:hypothetical protein
MQIPEAAMTSDDLTPQQAEVLKARVGLMLRYMNRLRQRMHKRKFPEVDELSRAVRDAHNALHHLNVHLHYLTVKSGVGRRRREGGG